MTYDILNRFMPTRHVQCYWSNPWLHGAIGTGDPRKNTNRMKHSSTYAGLLIAAIVMVAGSAMAGGGPPEVPDGGSTSLLLAGSLMGLAAVKRRIWR